MNNEYITISELTRYIKGIIDNNEFLNKVYIKGEISNFKNHTRGHYYFTLKDEKSRVNAVMFASSVKNIKFMPNDGMKVLVTGRISVYEATGGYQIYVDDMVEDGVGNLYVAFEQLKEKLGKEGLFDVAHKKKIRKVPRKIGIITASTGAAIKDILTTIKRRFPVCETILFPSLVQGEKAKEDIVRNIELANTYDLDTLIVGRGGGSIEDLWPFNEEIVARAIYNSKIPVISAVGHEIDYTIADFVADLRAPTPTAAAELAVPDITTILSYLDTAKVRSSNAISNLCDSKRMLLNKLEDSYILKRPMAIYEAKEQKLDNLIDNLRNAINKKIEIKKVKLFELTNSYVFYNPDIVLGVKRNNLENVIHKLDILNPLNTLKRGYTITRFNDKIITNASIVKKDDIITVEFVDGVVKSKILEVDK